MSARFVHCVLAGGSDESNQLPQGVKKNLLCGIKDIILVHGDVEIIKSKLPEQDIKWIRFMALSQEKKKFLGIRYSHPFKDEGGRAIYDIELVRAKRDTEIAEIKPTKGVFLKTVEAEDIESIEDLFG